MAHHSQPKGHALNVGRGTYEKDMLMATAVYPRAGNTKRDCVAYNVHRGGKKLTDMIRDSQVRLRGIYGRLQGPLEWLATARANTLPERTTKFIQTTGSVFGRTA